MELSMTTKEGLKITQCFKSNRHELPYKIVAEDQDKKYVMDDKFLIKQFKNRVFEVAVRNNGAINLKPRFFEDGSLFFEVLNPPVEDEIEVREEKE